MDWWTLLLISAIIWQCIVGILLIMRYYFNNIEVLPNQVGTTVISRQKQQSQPTVQQPIKAVEVETKKHIELVKTDTQHVRMDEETRGKVKTQKDKLRALRR